MTRQSQLDAVLSEAWEEYSKVVFVQNLGSCIRKVCPQMQTDEQSILNKLQGSCAVAYLEQHYEDK